MEELVIVNLDTLNKKQLLKEFKQTAKDVKSSDPLKKKNALDKIGKDSRYILEGECLIALIDSVIPKKVISQWICFYYSNMLTENS